MSSTEPPLLLTPTVKRRKKVSLSPVKSRKSPVKHRSASSSAPRTTDVEEPGQASYPSGALEFEDFSFWNDERGFNNISSKHLDALRQYLLTTFGVTDFLVSFPYLVLWCEDLPDLDTRPFTIAGCVAVWLEEGGSLPAELSLGDLGGGEDIALDSEVAKQLHPYHLPSATTLLKVAESFNSAQFVTFYNSGLIIELPEQSIEAYQDTLQKLPGGLSNCPITLGYYNGALATTEMRRAVKPNPKDIEGEFDDTDYIASVGCFYPGAMLTSTDNFTISAGVLVRNADKIRLTVAFHCWDEEFEKHAEKFGDPEFFKVTQGDLSKGTTIGYVAERLGNSDIGLVKLDSGIEFSNRFLDINTEAKKLLSSETIQSGDEFVIDGYNTGQQRLKCLGIRVRTSDEGKRERDFQISQGSERLLPPAGKYVALVQGIYATSALVIKSKPMIRAGVCGAAIVRSRRVGHGNVLDEGGVAGFMQFSDLRPKTMGQGELLCFCEALDDMIAEGWEVVKVPEKRKAEDEGEGNDHGH